MNKTQEFLSRARITDDSVGDLIADMKRDAAAPDLFRNIDHVRGYLLLKGACPGAIKAIPKFWRRYSRWVMRHPFTHA